MTEELLMYAPYRFPGASDWFVPFQAAMPPPHPRLAKVTFSNQLMSLSLEPQWSIYIAYAVPKPNRSGSLISTNSMKGCEIRS